MVKTDPLKPLISGYHRCGFTEEITSLYQVEPMLQCIRNYLNGIPYEYMSEENRLMMISLVQQYYDTVLDELEDRIVSYWKSRTPRYRPAFEKILRYLVRNMWWVIGKYREHPHIVYHVLSIRLGYRFATVRDAFWSFRRAGII